MGNFIPVDIQDWVCSCQHSNRPVQYLVKQYAANPSFDNVLLPQSSDDTCQLMFRMEPLARPTKISTSITTNRKATEYTFSKIIVQIRRTAYVV